ncbi:MAG: preprotein translocase subunit SecG [Anaerolineales bacterium]|nr:preprotein translocase subunit SecG [Anaerolineales bacterium]
MGVYLNIAQIIISAALIAIILLQVRSGGGLGSVFGGAESAVYKTRRGVERTIFNITIGLSVAFFVIAIVNVMVIG